MSRNLDRIFKVFGILVLAIVILGVASGVSLAPISIKRAEAQVGTITLSSSNLNPVKWIVLTVTGYEPGTGINTINIRATFADTGATINALWANGSILGYFTATRVSGTTFVAYVGGPGVSSSTPQNPLPGIDPSIYPSSFARLQLNENTDVNRSIVFTVVGTPITAQVAFQPVSPTIASIPDKPYRRDALVSISYTDLDLNKDPTIRDTIPISTSTLSQSNIANGTGYTLFYSYNSTSMILSINIAGNLKTMLNTTGNIFWFNYIVPGTVSITIPVSGSNISSISLVDTKVGTSTGRLSASPTPLSIVSRIDYITGDFYANLSIAASPTPTPGNVNAQATLTFDGPESSTASGILARLTLAKAPEAGGGSFQTPWMPLNRIVLPDTGEIRETAVDSNVFTIPTSIKLLSWVISKSTSYTIFPGITTDDRVIIEIYTTAALQSQLNTPAWNDRDVGQGAFKAIYTQPSISVDFKSTGIVITINSPDDNINPNARDTLDTGFDYGFASSVLRIRPRDHITGTWFGPWVAFSPGDIVETDVNTGLFQVNLSIRWAATLGDARLVKTGPNTGVVYYPTNFPDNVDLRPRIDVYYTTDNARREGYNIDRYVAALYTPTKASISLNKATTKTWDFSISKPDINNDPNAIETLTPVPSSIVSGGFNLTTSYGTTVAIIQFTDDKGNPLSIPASAIGFTETDFNSGVFRLVVNASQVSPLVAGGQYVLRYWDLAGFSITRGFVEFPFTIRGVVITFPGRADVPINRVNGVFVSISYANDAYNRDPTAFDSANVYVQITYVNGTTVTLYGSGGILGTAFTLGETDIDTGEFSGSLFLPPWLFLTPAIIDANLTVYDPLFVLPDGSNPRASIKIRPHAPTEFTINGSTAVTLRMGDAIVIRLVEPDWNWRTFRIDFVNVTVVPPRGSPFNVTLTETGTNTGVFVARIVVSWDDFNGTSFNNNVFPGDTVQIIYNDDTPVLSPTASSWTTVPLVVQFKVQSTTGRIVPETSEPGFVGPLEMFNVTVIDPDLDRFVDRADLYSPDNYVALRGGIIALSIEGIPQVVYYPLNETGLHTGTFRSVTALSIIDVLRANNIILPTDDAWTRAAKVAQFIGKKVLVSYIDIIDETGSRNVVNAILTIKAVDASIATDKDFVNIGEMLTITIYNKDIAGTDVPEYKQVFVSSTTIAVPQPFYLTEVAPGVFQINITVVSPSDWIPGAPQIPARLGDTIIITYYDPVTANGSSRVVFTKQVIVGRFLERPARVNSVDLLDPTTGAPVLPRVGVPILIAVNLSNIDVIDRQMTAFVVVRDANNVTVAIFFTTTTVPAGRSVVVGFSWIPFAAGNYTIEVLVFKLVTDRTPLAPDVFRRTITVSS
jgi:hypothetical protein